MFRGNAEMLFALAFKVQPCDSFDFILAPQRVRRVIADSTPSFREIEQFK